jgi:hypothetical protein
MAEPDLLKRQTDEIRSRLKELEPLVAEHERLQRALNALESGSGQQQQRRQGQPRRRRRSSGGRAGRGERRLQLLRILQAEPGRRPSEAAHLMGINPSQLHSLSRRMEEAGEIERRDGALYLASSTSPEAA